MRDRGFAISGVSSIASGGDIPTAADIDSRRQKQEKPAIRKLLRPFWEYTGFSDSMVCRALIFEANCKPLTLDRIPQPVNISTCRAQRAWDLGFGFSASGTQQNKVRHSVAAQEGPDTLQMRIKAWSDRAVNQGFTWNSKP